MGMTPSELLERVTSEEITEQMAFDQLEPDDPWLMTAMICYVIASFSGSKKKYKIQDFYLPSLNEEQTGRGIFNQLKARIKAAGG